MKRLTKRLLCLVLCFFGCAVSVRLGLSALPQQLKSARMTDSTLANQIDNEVGNLEKALADIFGIPLDTNITQALLTATAGSGISTIHGGTTLVFNSNGLKGAEVASAASAVNYIRLQASATTVGPILAAKGSDTNVDLLITAKGTGSHRFFTADGATERARITADGHLVPGIGTTPTIGACGTGPSVSGTDSYGVVSTGTGSPASCAVNFSKTYTTAPVCTFFSDMIVPSGGLSGAVFTTGFSVQTSGSFNTKLWYICIGHQ